MRAIDPARFEVMRHALWRLTLSRRNIPKPSCRPPPRCRCAAGTQTAQDVERIQEHFHETHARAYGCAARQGPMELVNGQLTVIGACLKPRLKVLPQGTVDFQAAMSDVIHKATQSLATAWMA